MKRKIDWLNHFLEFIVVVIGILLAFQLNTCSSNKKEARTIQNHIEQIAEETKFNLGSIDGSIRLGELNQRKLDTIFQIIFSTKDFNEINRLSIDLLNIGGVYFKKNAYSTMVQSGDIRFIKDLEKKQEIVGLYEYYKWVESIESLSLNDFNEDYYPYVKKHFDIVGGTIQSEEVYTGKEFKNILAAYSHLLGMKVRKYKDCKKEMEEYLNI